MGAEYEITDDELLDVAEDPEQAASLHRALRSMAGSPSVGPQLQEMAKEVLSGRMSMRDAVRSSHYLDAIGDRLSQIRDAAERMTPEERRASEERARKLSESGAATRESGTAPGNRA
ncbi:MULTISPECIES: hypothetical protein [Kitasatospora]|uniref:Uncharacterized protein n=1 Tax=Kitasatospora cystarginea TaxID=58350 RepID=A0ABP5RUW7_9ACTN